MKTISTSPAMNTPAHRAHATSSLMSMVSLRDIDALALGPSPTENGPTSLKETLPILAEMVCASPNTKKYYNYLLN